MSMINPKAKRWVFTVNNYTDEDENVIRSFGEQCCKYMICGHEVAPTTGTKHLQGYFHLMDYMYHRSIIKALISRDGKRSVLSFLAVAKGDVESNYKYCSKSGDFWEIGTLPSYLLKKKQEESATKEIMHDWLSLSPDDFDAKWPYQSLHWRRKLMDWEAARIATSGAWDGDLQAKNYWICGAPGTGKSRWVRSQCAMAQIYCKLVNKWWGGFNRRDHRIVLIEDFPGDGKYLGQLMKIWSDRYIFTGETKGGQLQIYPGGFFFCVTSNFSIDEIFDGIDARALKRRFKEVEIRSEMDIQLMTNLPKDILDFTK